MTYVIFIVFALLLVVIIFYGKQLWTSGANPNLDAQIKLLSVVSLITILVIAALSNKSFSEILKKYRTKINQ